MLKKLVLCINVLSLIAIHLGSAVDLELSEEAAASPEILDNDYSAEEEIHVSIDLNPDQEMLESNVQSMEDFETDMVIELDQETPEVPLNEDTELVDEFELSDENEINLEIDEGNGNLQDQHQNSLDEMDTETDIEMILSGEIDTSIEFSNVTESEELLNVDEDISTVSDSFEDYIEITTNQTTTIDNQFNETDIIVDGSFVTAFPPITVTQLPVSNVISNASSTVSHSTTTSAKPPPSTNIEDAELCSRVAGTFAFPVSGDCSKFILCNQSEALPGYCPSQMWFDPYFIDNVFCSLPEIICEANYNVCDCDKYFPKPTPDPLLEDHVYCAKDNKMHLFASEVECERYFICYNTKTFTMHCRNGLHFNAAEGVCDIPNQSMCKIKDPLCPDMGPMLVAHPTSCSSFYYCLNGFKIPQSCPAFNYFDEKEQMCKVLDGKSCTNVFL